MRNNRGVALIIVLLVTALLIALVFEFAYGTRVSLRAAVNFRDSQRAYFLARSGINAFVKYQALRDIPQGEWTVVPMISTGDTVVRIKWEDELGKICINSVSTDSSSTSSTDQRYTWLTHLFTNRVVSQEILSRIVAAKYGLLSELHFFMKDEDYNKVAPFMTVYSEQGTLCSGFQKVNINNAPEEVLRSILPTKTTTSISDILSKRKDQKYVDADLAGELFGSFTASKTVYKLYSYATVGGYTKQIEAVVNLSGTVSYWKAL